MKTASLYNGMVKIRISNQKALFSVHLHEFCTQRQKRVIYGLLKPVFGVKTLVLLIAKQKKYLLLKKKLKNLAMLKMILILGFVLIVFM